MNTNLHQVVGHTTKIKMAKRGGVSLLRERKREGGRGGGRERERERARFGEREREPKWKSVMYSSASAP